MIRKILLAYDRSENACRALEVAAELATKLQADLSILHVLMHGRPAEEMVRMAEIEHLAERVQNTINPGVSFATGRVYDLFTPSQDNVGMMRMISVLGDHLLDSAKSQAEDLGVQNVQTTSRNGDYADQILDTANEEEADMIVLGSRGLGKIRGTVLGSVSQKVLHHATQTVVAVK